MNVLALDTSMGACSAALLRHDGGGHALFARQETMARGHAEALMPMVADIMSEGGTDFAALDLIAATTGPGSFTGVRIAISAARGLALVTGAKLFGTDSLTVMAQDPSSLRIASGAPFAVAVDARRGMLYFGLYDGEGRKIEGPFLIAPDDAAHLLASAARIAVGSGAALLADATARRGIRIEASLLDLQPSAAFLAALAAGTGERAAVLRPLYLRPPDARPQGQDAVARR